MDGLFIPKEKIESEKRSLTIYDRDYGKNILTLYPISTMAKEQADAMNVIPENKPFEEYPSFDEEMTLVYIGYQI